MTQYSLPAPFVFARIADGDGYLVNTLLTVPASGSASVHIRNPDDDKVMWIGTMDITAEGNQHFHLHDTFNSVTDGTEIEIQNALMDAGGGAPDSGPFEAYTDSTYDSVQEYPLGFTSTDKKSVTTIDTVASAMEPGRELVIEYENQDSTEYTAFFGALILSSY